MSKDDYNDNQNIKNNITSILLYALSLATALGFNDLVLTIFNSFEWSQQRLLFKIVYVMLMFSITIGVAYYLKGSLKT